jgi:hypothetical protein
LRGGARQENDVARSCYALLVTGRVVTSQGPPNNSLQPTAYQLIFYPSRQQAAAEFERWALKRNSFLEEKYDYANHYWQEYRVNFTWGLVVAVLVSN